MSSEFFPAGYKIFRKDRHDGYGGVLLACCDSLNCHQLLIDSEAEIVACQIAFDNQESLTICAFYRPPSKELESVLKLCDTFEYILSLHPHLPTWLVGDLNLPNIDWDHYCIRTLLVCVTQLLILFMNIYGFIQTVDFATRDNNILDVFFTNRPCLIRRCYPIVCISDHEALFIESFITLNLQPLKPRKIHIWHKANMSSFKNLLIQSSQLFFSKFSLSTPINTLWEEFKSICFDCLSLNPQNSVILQLNN